jgi:arabinan endo-1,5-alpha-L-arabinosidase
VALQGYQGGTIDPQPFTDPVSKKPYLIFKNDGNHNQTAQTRIWIQELSPDGLHLLDQPRSILQPTQSWHKNLIEAPYLVYHSPSKNYVLFFSSGFFGNEDYATGYAISKSLFGPYKAERKVFLGTDERRQIRGPGGISVIEKGPEGNWMVAFHAHDKKGGGQRVLCVHRLEWSQDGHPMLAGKAAHFGHRLTMGEEHKGDETRDHAQEKGADEQGQPKEGTEKKKRMSKVMQWIKDY